MPQYANFHVFCDTFHQRVIPADSTSNFELSVLPIMYAQKQIELLP